MSDRSYYWARGLCFPFFWVSSRPIVVHPERATLPGGYILASNHLSTFDAPVLVGYTPRDIDFLTLGDLRHKPLAHAFLSCFNVIYVDRRRRDNRAVREMVRRLRQGRVIGWFPEGAVRTAEASIINGGPIDADIARIAAIAPAPVIPCVVLGADRFRRVRSWLPLRAVRYGIIYGQPLRIDPHAEPPEARERFLKELRQAYADLNRELIDCLKANC
jgi:1-acyl-sn-glycerol-3-phosphate acyltransferase